MVCGEEKEATFLICLFSNKCNGTQKNFKSEVDYTNKNKCVV